jgi:hypothetical protein
VTAPAPSQRCFGPYSNTPAQLSWNPPSYLRRCTNPAHNGHFVDTRTGVILTCNGTFVSGRAPGPANHKRCLEHGHIVNTDTREVIG